MDFKPDQIVAVKDEHGSFRAIVLKRCVDMPGGPYLVVSSCCRQMLFVEPRRLRPVTAKATENVPA